MLVAGTPFKKTLWGSLSMSVAFTGMAVMIGITFGDMNTIEIDCQVSSYDFDSVSVDLSKGYLDDGSVMMLPHDAEVIHGHPYRMMVTGKCLCRKNGWWSPFDVMKHKSWPKTKLKSTLYVR
jgi:hypothetical protein